MVRKGSRCRFGAVTLALLTVIITLPSSAEAPGEPAACTLHAAGTRAVVRVIDAETVLLDDNREVRLIGALAPRAPGMGGDSQTWAPEQAAVTALRDLVLGRPVELAYTGRRSDRYGRLLAHLFLERNGERVWVQGELLSGGHARAYGLPGSFACTREMLAHERVARDARAGLWSNGAYRTLSAQRPRTLMRYRNTYQIIEGRLAGVAPTKARTYLNFGADWRSDFTAGVAAGVLRDNPEWAKTLAALEGRRVEVRGWIEYRNGPYINVEDPSQIAVVEEGGPSTRPGGPTMSSDGGRAPPSASKQKRPALSGPGALDL